MKSLRKPLFVTIPILICLLSSACFAQGEKAKNVLDKGKFLGYWNTYTEDVGPDLSVVSKLNGRKYKRGIDSIYFYEKNDLLLLGGNGGEVVIDSIVKEGNKYIFSIHFNIDNGNIVDERIELILISADKFYFIDKPDQEWPGFYYPGPSIMYMRAPLVDVPGGSAPAP